MKNNIHEIWGIRFLLSDMSGYINYLDSILENSDKIVLNGVNPYSLSLIHKNPELLNALAFSSVANVDGILLKVSLQFLGYKVPARLDTPSIFRNLMIICQNRKYNIYLIGSSDKELTIIKSRLEELYKGISVVGSHHGYFSDNESSKIIDDINMCDAHIILLGMPSPKKEVFMYRNIDKLQFKLSLGVGGVFDIISGKNKEAPLWVKNMNIEWLYRFVQEPKRLFERYLSMFLYFFRFIWETKRT